MTPDAQSIAAAYLAPSVDAFWRWTADGEAMTWVDGKTIAFRQEVEAVLRRLAPGGLPPFGSVALLLAAGRDGWEGSDWRDRVVGYANVFERWKAGTGEPRAVPLHASQFVFQRIARDVGRVIDGLDAVARLPRDLRDNTQAKTVLAETVFEPAAKRLAPEDAALVIRALDDGINPELLLPRLTTRESLSLFAEDVDGLRLGLPKVDPKALALRLRTGLDETPKSADVDLGPPEQVRRLLAELRADLELSGLAKLARDLMAAVYVPRALQARDEMPLGGVSDLSNRGPLDRLLVSELAHDDLTLAVRVAVNEALYLRRESPPKSPPVRRAILLDQGIRLWGVPRVFATAVALALAATADPRGGTADLPRGGRQGRAGGPHYPRGASGVPGRAGAGAAPGGGGRGVPRRARRRGRRRRRGGDVDRRDPHHPPRRAPRPGVRRDARRGRGTDVRGDGGPRGRL